MRLINATPLNQDFMSEERRYFLRNNLSAAEHIPVIGSNSSPTTATVVVVVVVVVTVTGSSGEVDIQV